MTPKEKAEQHYKNAVAARKNSEAQRALNEIKSALDVENKQEYFFERAWAQIQLAHFDDAAVSLKMIAHIGETRPSSLVIDDEVKLLHDELAIAQTRLKAVKKALNAATKQKDPAAMLAAITGKTVEEMKELIIPSIRLKSVAAEVSSGDSKIGGNPELSKGSSWPTSENGAPLAFLCQIDLSLLTEIPTESRNLLQFFYDNVEQPTGDGVKEKSQWRVILTDATKSEKTEPPAGMPKENIFKEKKLEGSSELTFPDIGQLSEVATLSRSIRDLYFDSTEKWYGKTPWHRHGGNSQNVQDEMKSALEEMFGAAGQSWHLLLQLDTDESLGMCWGDGGRLYFWIQEQDFKARKFENVWLFMQCY